MVKFKKVSGITFYQDGNDIHCRAAVGLDAVIDIIYHEPTGEGDKHFCDIVFSNHVKRVFNLDTVVFEISEVKL